MEEVEDEPLFADRVAGLDIAKAAVEVTIRVPSDTAGGRRRQETRTFGTTRRELLDLAAWLACWEVTKAGGAVASHPSASSCRSSTSGCRAVGDYAGNADLLICAQHRPVETRQPVTHIGGSMRVIFRWLGEVS
jgi:hypothetical protein